MRNAFAFAALAALGLGAPGCATAPAPAIPVAVSAPAPVEALPPRSGYGAVIARAGGAGAPQLSDVVRRLGEADIDNREGVGAMLTYRADACALVLVFASDTLAEAHALPRQTGGAAPALDDCVEAVYARNRR
ncbi:MAG: hypothetical protein GC206_03860 [Alphaproteobacteria bacterium]|nr:hypothetical protein [Alphaproteobacteria bacterium]